MSEQNTEHKQDQALIHHLKADKEAKLLGLLGFAAKARKLVPGADLCRDAVRRGSVILVLLASDASENTKKRITDACKYYETDLGLLSLPSAELSARIGKSGQIAVVGVTDAHFAEGIFSLFED